MKIVGMAKIDRPSMHGLVLLICGAFASTILGRSFTALRPGSFDAQLFAYIGLQWLRGNIPYVDVWDHKPPGIFAMNASVFLLFPKSFTALACMEGIFILGCIGTVYLLMREWKAPWVIAALSTASVAIAANLARYNARGNLAEIYLLWPATLSIYFFARAVPTFQGQWIFFAGVCSGVASLLKPVGLSPLLAQSAFLLLLWAVFRRLSLRHLVAAMVTNSAGVIVAWLPFALYFWRHGALREFVHASFVYNIQYGKANWDSAPSILVYAVGELYPLAGLLISAAVLGVIYVRWAALPCGAQAEEKRWPGAYFWCPLVLLWVFSDLSGALAGGRNYSQYFLVLVPSLSVASGFTCWFLIRKLPSETRRWYRNGIFAFIIGPLILAHIWDLRVFWKAPPVESWKVVANRLNAIRSPKDSLFIWDYLPGIYLRTGMKSPARQLDAHYIFDSVESHKDYGEQILQKLMDALPTFIVDGNIKMIKQSRTSAEILKASDPVYRKFRRFLEEQYSLVYTCENLRVYKHDAAHLASSRATEPSRLRAADLLPTSSQTLETPPIQ